MSYVAKVLQPDEKVIHVTGPHWRVYLPAILLVILAIVCIILSQQTGSTLTFLLLIAAAVCVILAIAAWVQGFIQRQFTELAVTDRRIIFKRGIFRRYTIEMNMAKVESIDVDQTIPGRLLGYGTVTIHGTGGGIAPLTNIDDPLTFRNHVTAA